MIRGTPEITSPIGTREPDRRQQLLPRRSTLAKQARGARPDTAVECDVIDPLSRVALAKRGNEQHLVELNLEQVVEDDDRVGVTKSTQDLPALLV